MLEKAKYEKQEKLKRELEQLKPMVQQKETELQEQANRNIKTKVNNETAPFHTATGHANRLSW